MAAEKTQDCVPVDHDQIPWDDYKTAIKEKATEIVDKFKSPEKSRIKILCEELRNIPERAKQSKADWTYCLYLVYVCVFMDVVRPWFKELSPTLRERYRAQYDAHNRVMERVFTMLEGDLDDTLRRHFDGLVEKARARAAARAAEKVRELAQYVKKVPDAETIERRVLFQDETNAREAIRLNYARERPLSTVYESDLPYTPAPTLPAFSPPPAAPAAPQPPPPAYPGLPTPADAAGADATPVQGLPAAAPPAPPVSGIRSLVAPDDDAGSAALDALLGNYTKGPSAVTAAHVDPSAGAGRDDAWRNEFSAVAQPSTAPDDATAKADHVMSQLLDDQDRISKVRTDAVAAEALRLHEEEAARVRREEAAAQERQRQAAMNREQERLERELAHEQQKQAQLVQYHEQYLAKVHPYAERAWRSVAAWHQQLMQRLDGHPVDCYLLSAVGKQEAQSCRRDLDQMSDGLADIARGPAANHPQTKSTSDVVGAAKRELETALSLAEAMESRSNQMRQPNGHGTASPPQPASPSTRPGPPSGAPQRCVVKRIDKEALHAHTLAESRWTFPVSRQASGPQARRGLVNLGNTCYMNSILQSMMATRIVQPFLTDQYIESINIDNPLGSTGRVVNTFVGVVRDMNKHMSYPVSPSSFKGAVGGHNDMFQGQSQQDANEFMQTLLGCLHEDLNRVRKRTPIPDWDTKGMAEARIAEKSLMHYKQNNCSYIVDLFGFQERSVVTCPLCRYESCSFNVSHSLLLPINTRDKSTIADCLSMYTDQERLPEGSEWGCGGCGKKVRAYKKLSLWTAPKTLVMTLSRFRTTGNLADKIRQQVMFPPRLDLTPFLTSPDERKRVYELVAVVNHDGGLGGGHYTADVKGRLDKQWYSFSDERSTHATGSPDFSKAYILFYSLIE
eukprot:Rhum_TRINITY_DN4260_c0_g1::Rhum_TRINITY_DN4260_c0_g1_i1::g.13645::m.13645/K11839/USP8, UBP5; ubiquitin carboxyl-terminal hydrolase 8